MNAAMAGVVLGFVVVIYAPVTYIMLRNIPFRPALKYPFCLTIVPVFVVLLVVGIALVYRLSPETVALISRNPRGEKWLIVLIILPIPAFGSWLWYLLFRLLDRVFVREA